MNKYTPSDGQFISSITEKHKAVRHSLKNTDKDDFTRFQVFGKDKILQLLNRPEAVGLKITNGICEEGQNEVILSAITETGQVIKKTAWSAEANPEEETYLSNGPRCPKTC